MHHPRRLPNIATLLPTPLPKHPVGTTTTTSTTTTTNSNITSHTPAVPSRVPSPNEALAILKTYSSNSGNGYYDELLELYPTFIDR
jgi:hypothetical protein